MPRPVLLRGHNGAGVCPPPISLPSLPPSPGFYLHPGASAHLRSPAGQRHSARLGPAWPARRGAADAGTMRSLPPELRRIVCVCTCVPPHRLPGCPRRHTHGCAQSPAGCGAGSEEGEGEKKKIKKAPLCNFAHGFSRPAERGRLVFLRHGASVQPPREHLLCGGIPTPISSHAPPSPKQPVQAPAHADIQNIKQN